MIPHPPESGNTHTDEIRDAAWNAVAVASLAYHRELTALRVILRSATEHGMTFADILDATGLDGALVGRLLDEVA